MTDKELQDILRSNPDIAVMDGNVTDTEPGEVARANKWHNVPTVRDGIRFASKREACRFDVLQRLRTDGTITELRLQPSFTLLESYMTPDGERVRSLRYVADFSYVQDGRTVVEDVKGVETPEFKLKRKLFRERYPTVNLIIVKKGQPT